MRERIARRLVKATSGWYENGYRAYETGHKTAERMSLKIARFESRFFLPIALKIDRESAVDQMVTECWWG